MSDTDLRDLERLALGGDPVGRYRWRVELVRLGRGDEAGLRSGDKVTSRRNAGVGVVRRVLATRARIWFDLFPGSKYGTRPAFRLRRNGSAYGVTLLEPARP